MTTLGYIAYIATILISAYFAGTYGGRNNVPFWRVAVVIAVVGLVSYFLFRSIL